MKLWSLFEPVLIKPMELIIPRDLSFRHVLMGVGGCMRSKRTHPHPHPQSCRRRTSKEFFTSDWSLDSSVRHARPIVEWSSFPSRCRHQNRYQTNSSSIYSSTSMLLIYFLSWLIWIVVSILCYSVIVERFVPIFSRSWRKISDRLKVQSFIFDYPMLMKHSINMLVSGVTISH